MDKLIFVKLGGSILTDKTQPEKLNAGVLGQVAAVIAEHLQHADAPHMLIGHGGGSFGHYWADLYQTQHGVKDARGWEGVVRVADAMSCLNRQVVEHLIAAGVNALGVQPSASAVAVGGTLESMAVHTLSAWLTAGLVPVVFGDVVVDLKQGAAIVSTETLFAFLAPLLQPRRLVLVGELAVYTADPRRDPQAKRIPIIDDTNIEQVLHQVSGSHGVDVTGGMASKVGTMWRLVNSLDTLEVDLIGSDSATLRAVLRGKPVMSGTRIRRNGGTG